MVQRVMPPAREKSKTRKVLSRTTRLATLEYIAAPEDAKDGRTPFRSGCARVRNVQADRQRARSSRSADCHAGAVIDQNSWKQADKAVRALLGRNGSRETVEHWCAFQIL